jgi:hypothetical protein
LQLDAKLAVLLRLMDLQVPEELEQAALVQKGTA